MSLDTLKAKVGQLIEMAKKGGGDDDFIGIKYSNFRDEKPILPRTVDARSLDKILTEPSKLGTSQRNAENGCCLLNTCRNTSANEGYFLRLEEAYLPSKASGLRATFQYCRLLTTIHGDFSNIEFIQGAFLNCISLDINALLARMPKLYLLEGSSFQNCTQATEIILPSTLTSIASNAFSGCTNVTDVYCPWAEGAVKNAPWGMTNATIHYNYNAEV